MGLEGGDGEDGILRFWLIWKMYLKGFWLDS